jgi:hypothetical protein
MHRNIQRPSTSYPRDIHRLRTAFSTGHPLIFHRLRIGFSTGRPQIFHTLSTYRQSQISVLVSQFTLDSQRFQIEEAIPEAGTAR